MQPEKSSLANERPGDRLIDGDSTVVRRAFPQAAVAVVEDAHVGPLDLHVGHEATESGLDELVGCGVARDGELNGPLGEFEASRASARQGAW